MKKILAIVLSLSMLLAISGCSSSSGLKTGLGSVTSIRNSKAATAEDGAKAQVDTTLCSLTVDAKGKIVSVSFDEVQGKVAYDKEGALKSDPAAAVKTKKQLGAEYNMKPASPIGKEWFEQIAALEQYLVGKTVDEAKAMPVKQKDEAHPSVPDVAELTSSCTMNVGGYLAALDAAASNIK